METTAELRYFWRNAVPAEVERWFRSGMTQGGGHTRTDHYLRDPKQTELGIKLRGGEKPGVEIKGLVANTTTCALPPFAGQIEIWSKWTTSALDLNVAKCIALEKQRWLRRFKSGTEIPVGAEPGARPENGCDFELTRVALPDGGLWWTLGFEAFGPLESLEQNLISTLQSLRGTNPPPIDPPVIAGYPVWLGRIVG